MSKNVYNIVWADDEIDDLLDNDTIEDLEDLGFKVLCCAHDGQELESFIDKKSALIDAVIVDANFNESAAKIESERDTSGLDYARGLFIHKLKRSIPFFLFTNRTDELLRDIYKNNTKFLDDFPRHKRWFNKSGEGEFKQMLEEIKRTVEDTQSPSFVVRTQYADELKIAELFPDAERILMEGLLLGHDAVENIQDLFNPIRGIVEQLVTKLQQLGYLPCVSLNCIPRLFLNEGKFEEGYALKKSFMHKTLAQSFAYFLSITQDGSHKKEDVRLKVFDYSLSRQNTNLYKSVLFIAMDLLLWFRDTLMVDPDPENILRTYIEEGIVMKYPIENNKSQHYVGKYQLQWKEGLKEGVKVGIFKASSSKQPYKDITEFVLRKDYDILTDQLPVLPKNE